MRDEFYFPSKDGNTEIHTIEWKPEGEVKAVLQLSHGMVEYIKRYDEFAEFMCSHGYYVVGNDHLGHGKSVQSKSEYGFFNEKYGNACVIGDMHTLRQRTAKKYPEVPYFMLPSASVCADVWKWTGRSNVYRSCSRPKEINTSVCKETLQDTSDVPWLAL